MFTKFQKSLLLFLFINQIRCSIFRECKQTADESFVAIANNCLGYIYCRGEESFTGLCPAGTYFDQQMQQCSVDTSLKCSDYIATIGEELTQQGKVQEKQQQQQQQQQQQLEYSPPITISPEATEVTTGEFNGAGLLTTPHSPHRRPHCSSTTINEYFPYKFHCEYYYRCSRGYLSILRCAFGHGWDFLIEKCLPLKDTRCYKLSEKFGS